MLRRTLILSAMHFVSGDYGVPKPWYFMFTKSYWCSSQNRKHRSVGVHGDHSTQVYRVLGDQVSDYNDLSVSAYEEHYAVHV